MSRSNRRSDGSLSIDGTSGRSTDREVDRFGSAVDVAEDGSPSLGKADSFGFAPPNRWVGLVRGTSSPRMAQYPRPLRDKWCRNFQIERNALCQEVWTQDHHEGYIGWEMYETNQRQIVFNHNGKARPGAAREGESLLQGLVLCGICDRRMKVRYVQKCRLIRYECLKKREQIGAPIC